MNAPFLHLLDADGLKLAQGAVTAHHYLGKPVDVRSMPEAYAVHPKRVGSSGLGSAPRSRAFRARRAQGELFGRASA